MVMFKHLFPILLLLAGIGLASTAQAELIDRAFAVYDTVSHLSWLKDANYAQTSGYDADGQMTWADANTWANGLTVGGFTGWRLPTALNADGSGPCGPGYNCTTSELGYLYYTDGGLSQGQNITSSAVLSGLFSNMQNFVYWSGAEYAPFPLSRGTSIPALAASSSAVRTMATMRGPCALAMSPPCQSRA